MSLNYQRRHTGLSLFFNVLSWFRGVILDADKITYPHGTMWRSTNASHLGQSWIWEASFSHTKRLHWCAPWAVLRAAAIPVPLSLKYEGCSWYRKTRIDKQLLTWITIREEQQRLWFMTANFKQLGSQNVQSMVNTPSCHVNTGVSMNCFCFKNNKLRRQKSRY